MKTVEIKTSLTVYEPGDDLPDAVVIKAGQWLAEGLDSRDITESIEAIIGDTIKAQGWEGFRIVSWDDHEVRVEARLVDLQMFLDSQEATTTDSDSTAEITRQGLDYESTDQDFCDIVDDWTDGLLRRTLAQIHEEIEHQTDAARMFEFADGILETGEPYYSPN